MNKFTRKMMLAIACIIAGCINVQAQYQLPNPGFEGTWKETTWGGFLGKSTMPPNIGILSGLLPEIYKV